VGWWKLDDASGTTAIDSSGQGNTGTLNNGATWLSSGLDGGALVTDGGDDYAVCGVGGAGSPLAVTNLTVSFWSYVTNKTQTANVVDRRNSAGSGYAVAWQGQFSRVTVQTPGAPAMPIQLADIAESGWHHIAYTCGGTNLAGYLNGLHQVTKTLSNAVGSSSNALHLARTALSTNYFAGRLDDVRVYSQPLAAGDIVALADTDTDGDGLLNIQESRLGTDPNGSDTDGDGMPDGWEVRHGLQSLTSDGNGDDDSDGDGMPDGYEVTNGLNLLVNDANGDLDGDGLSNAIEYQLGTNANSPDSDSDGMPDGWQYNYSSCGLDPLDASDADDNPDGDACVDIEEYKGGTSPCSNDCSAPPAPPAPGSDPVKEACSAPRESSGDLQSLWG
jgi:hypothetical protein